MGCDIHVYVEYRITPTAPWQAAPEHINVKEDEEYERVNSVDSTGRNYELFAALAGVRGDGPDAKGLPDNVSDLIRLAAEQWDGDGHSHSYYSLDEFEEILKQTCDYLDWSDKCETAFWEWNDYDYHGKDGKSKPPQDYVTLINYCRKLQKEVSQIDDILLGGQAGTTAEIRIVFWFDN